MELEKAFELGKMVMAILKWIGASEAEMRMVEAVCKNTKEVYKLDQGHSEVCSEVMGNISWMQGSALSTFLLVLP